MDYVTSILAAYDGATAEQHERGAVWYRDYLRRLAAAAERTDTPLHRALGVVAVSSINTRPEPGLRWAERFMAGQPGGHLPMVCAKAARILAEAETLDAARDIATPYSPSGPRKVRSFACNVATGGETCEHDTPCVTIDRWATYVATGGAEKSVPEGRKYDTLAAAYREAAAQRGVSPAIMQAVTWITVAE